MPITLTELVREFAQSAVALDRVCARAGHDLFLEDSDFAPDPQSAGSVSVPQTETVMLNGSMVDVPKTSLRDQHGLQAKAFKLSVSSDVTLEGQRVYYDQSVESPPAVQESVYEAVCTFTFAKGSRSNGAVVGFDAKVDPHFGQITSSSSLMIGEAEHEIAALFYVNINRRVVMRVHGTMKQSQFAGARLRLRDPSDSSRETTLAFDEGNWGSAEVYGSMYWVTSGQLNWLDEITAGGEVKVSIMQPVNIAAQIEADLSQQGSYRSEVVVTFREGLVANAAHLTLEVEFERQSPSEGVSLMNDRLNQDLATQLT